MSEWNPNPNGNDAATQHHREIYRQTNKALPLRSSSRVKVQRSSTGTFLRISRVPGGKNAGFNWQTPNKELDPSKAVAKGTFVYLSPNNPLVASGSPAGIWQAVQNVPASSSGAYNAPQYPYPGATGTPSGSPLAGDLDGTGVYWVLWSTPQCI